MKWVLLLLFALPAIARSSGPIGTVGPPYPDGYREAAGTCITLERGYQGACDYSIAVLEDTQKIPRFLYGARLQSRNSTGQSQWLVLDAMAYPELPHGYFVAIGVCRFNGRDDATLVAAARFQNTEIFKDIMWVKQFDIVTEKFIDHSVVGVDCINAGWGAE